MLFLFALVLDGDCFCSLAKSCGGSTQQRLQSTIIRMLLLPSIVRQLRPHIYTATSYRFGSRSGRRKEILTGGKGRDAAILKAAAKAKIGQQSYSNNEKTTELVDWKSLWWLGLVPLLGIGALAAANDDWKDRFLKESWIYSVIRGNW